MDDSLSLIATLMVMGRSRQHQLTLFTFYLIVLQRETLQREREELGRSVRQDNGGRLNLAWKRPRSC